MTRNALVHIIYEESKYEIPVTHSNCATGRNIRIRKQTALCIREDFIAKDQQKSENNII